MRAVAFQIVRDAETWAHGGVVDRLHVRLILAAGLVVTHAEVEAEVPVEVPLVVEEECGDLEVRSLALLDQRVEADLGVRRIRAEVELIADEEEVAPQTVVA